MHSETTIRPDFQGEPVHLTDAFDPFYNECRHTDRLPSWLQLQQEILTKLNRLLAGRIVAEADLQPLNRMIEVYNASVPNVHMQKPSLKAEELDDALEQWQ